MPGTLLLADNSIDFIESWAKIFRRMGYTVILCKNPEEAERALLENYVHLAILDLRMVNDQDDDFSGLRIARDERFSAIPKIIVTLYPSYQTVREALDPTEDGQSPKLMYVAKEEGPQALLQAVKGSFERYVRINHDLSIRWSSSTGLTSFNNLPLLVEPSLPTDRIGERASEWEDLFRRVFYDNEGLIFSQLLSTQPERVTFVCSLVNGGQEDRLVVVCGTTIPLAAEPAIYYEIKKELASPGGATLVYHENTTHCALLAYRLEINQAEPWLPLITYLLVKTDKQSRQALENLFRLTLTPWVKLNCTEQESFSANLLPQMSIPIDADGNSLFHSRAEHLLKVCREHHIATLHHSSDRWTLRTAGGRTIMLEDPFRCWPIDRSLPGVLCVVSNAFGGLDPATVVVSGSGRCALTQFGAVGTRPSWLDPATLEYTLREHMLEGRPPDVLYDFERILCAPDVLTTTPHVEDLEAELRRAGGLFATLRSLAAEVYSVDMASYLVGMYWVTACALFEYDPERSNTQAELNRFAGLLVRLSVLAEKLVTIFTAEPKIPPASPGQYRKLVVDLDNREVSLGGQKLILRPREFDLFTYIYKRAGELCTRNEILKDALGVQIPSPNDDNMLNTYMGRVRKQIKGSPSNPPYIETVHKEGFKLILPTD